MPDDERVRGIANMWTAADPARLIGEEALVEQQQQTERHER
jgi:hypothetical protein